MTFFPAIPWWLCLILAAASYISARVFDRYERSNLGSTFYPAAAGICRLLVWVIVVVGIINIVQRLR